MPRAPTRTLPRPTVLSAGPFRGMRDAPEPPATDPALAQYAGNMCRRPGPVDAGLVSRPGFRKMGATLSGTCQAIRTWTRATGARSTVTIMGGKLYTYDWNTAAWSEVVTASNLASKSITLSSAARVALVPFADGLVVSDGVNVPFHWDGTSGAGGLTKMTNCPVLYGPPTVYYSKLVGIKAAARNTMVWSEEGDPNVGYEAGGYNNAWDNPGGYSDPLTAVVGTNEALYVLRERTTIAITGAVTSDWATAGTRANVSEDVGTMSPWATLATASGVLVVDADARPQLFRPSDPRPFPLWPDCAQTVRLIPRAVLGEVQAVQDDATQSYVIGYPEVGQTNVTALLAFAQDDWQFTGVWWWGEGVQRLGPVVDGNGVARWAHAGLTDACLYVHGDLEDGPHNDELQSGTRLVEGNVTSAPLGYDVDRELVIDEIEAGLSGTGMTSVTVSYETPRGASLAQTVPLVAGVGLVWDVGKWDEGNWAGITRDQRVRVGTRGRGRWVRVSVRHSANNEPFGITLMRVRAFSSQGNPKAT